MEGRRGNLVVYMAYGKGDYFVLPRSFPYGRTRNDNEKKPDANRTFSLFHLSYARLNHITMTDLSRGAGEAPAGVIGVSPILFFQIPHDWGIAEGATLCRIFDILFVLDNLASGHTPEERSYNAIHI